jgi:hypothetical protein
MHIETVKGIFLYSSAGFLFGFPQEFDKNKPSPPLPPTTYNVK